MRKKRVLLKDHRHVALVCTEAIRGLTIEADRPRGGLFQTGHQAQQSRFSSAGWPDDHEEFAGSDGEGQVSNGSNVVSIRAVKPLGNIIEDNAGHSSFEYLQKVQEMPREWKEFLTRIRGCRGYWKRLCRRAGRH